MAKSFGVRFSCTVLKRERIAEQLTLFLNDALVEGAMLRRERANQKDFAKFTRADGQIVNARSWIFPQAACRCAPISARSLVSSC